MRVPHLVPFLLVVIIVLSSPFALPARAETRDLQLTFPVGGERLTVGSSQSIGWESYEDYEMDLYLSTNSGRTYDIYLGSGTGGAFSWRVPDIPTERARIKITGEIRHLTRAPLIVEDTSGDDFSIVPSPVPPVELSAVALSSSEIKLSWSDGTEEGDLLIVERDGEEVAQMGWDEETFLDAGLEADTTYYYRLRVCSAAGSCDYSDRASATTFPDDTVDTPPSPEADPIIIRLSVDSTDYQVGDEILSMDATPILREGRTLLPIRYVAEPLGAFVSWNPDPRKVTVSLDDTLIELWVGDNQARVNGEDRFVDYDNPDVMPEVIPPGRTVLPLRFIAESLGCEVEWDAPTRGVTITYKPVVDAMSIPHMPGPREDCANNVITFDDFDEGTPLFNQYASVGITFPGVPSIVKPEQADLPSGTKALGPGAGDGEFGGKLVIEFTTGQSCVSIFAGFDEATAGNQVLATLEAFDAGETVIIPGYGMEVYPPKQVAIQQGLLGPGSTGVFRKMTVDTEDEALIRRVEISYQGGYSPVVDDLRFSLVGEPFEDLQTTPRATIETPLDGEVISGFGPHSGAIDLMGTVHEEFKLRSLTYTVTREEDIISGPLPFAGDAPTYTFGGTNMHGLVAEGENRIAVRPSSWSKLSNVSQSGVATVHLETLLESDDEAELLILTPDEFYHSLVPLRDWKNATGISTHIMTLSSIERDARFSGSRDIAERVKRAIAHAYENHDTRYVMLVGDGDQFPVRYFKTGRQNVSWGVVHPITDLYYACLFDTNGSFDDWDGNGNGIIGEWWAPVSEGDWADNFVQMNIDNCSVKPDVALGRVPASTVEEVEAYVSKVIEYEDNSSHAYENVVVWNGPTDFRSDHLELDLVVEDIFSDFNVSKHYRPGEYGSWDSDEQREYRQQWRTGLGSDLGQGATFAVYFGHGSRTSMGVLRREDLQGLTNVGVYPVFVASACDTAKFVHEYDIYRDVDGNYPPCWPSCPPADGDTWPGPNPEPAPIQSSQIDVDSMAEALLLLPEGGGVGFLGAHSGTNDASHPFVKLFLDAYGSEGVGRLGGMWKDGVTSFAEQYLESGHWFGRSNLMSRHIHIFVLFGDPSLRLKMP
ncbi:MAG: C25 family cysteine peptidase [Bacillota bacterium]